MSVNLQLSEEQRKAKAIELHRVATGGLQDHLYALMLINNDKFYVELGFESMEEYCKEVWSYARSTMFGYLQVATKFLPIGIEENSVQHVGLFSLGLVKLQILSVLEDHLINELAVKGTLKLGDTTYTLQQLREMDREKLRELITGKVKEPAPPQMNIPFPKVYDNAEKYFTKIMNDVIACPVIIQPDKVKIRIAIEEAARVFDMYKKMGVN
jgi:hypothetical protein